MNNSSQATKHNFVNVFEKFLNAVLIVDYSRRIIYVNSKMANLLSIKREKLIEKNIIDILIGIENLCAFPKSLEDNQNREIQTIEAYFTLKKGKKRYFDIKTFPILEGTLLIILDRTETREIEQKLKESEKKIKEMVDLLPDIIYETDLQLKITYANSVAFQKFGYSQEDFKEGLNVIQMLSPIDLERAKERITKILEGEIVKPEDYLMKKKDGTEFYGRIHTRPIWHDGKITGMRGIISDITENKLAEQRLKESEEKFRVIAEQSVMGILIIQDDVFKYVNQQATDIFGYNIEEVMNLPPGGYSVLIHPDDRDMGVEQARKKQAGAKDVTTHYQLRGTKKSGETIWIEIVSKSILFNGKLADFATVIDITLKKEAEKAMSNLLAEIKRQNEKLLKVDREKDEMLDIVAHELRTPLASILGFIELLLKEDSNLTPFQTQYFSVIERNAQRLNKLIKQILDKSRIEMGKMDLKTETIDVRQLIYSILEELNFQVRQKLHNIHVKIPPKFQIQADLERIHQVFSNLLSNAIKYTPNGGIISIEAKKHGLKAIFSVKDSGIGIKKEDLPHIFEKFITIDRIEQKTIGDVKGIGLGLNITKQIVELHGGKMWVESEGINKGTTFYFELPILQ